MRALRALFCALLMGSCFSVASGNQTDELLSGVFKHLDPGERPVIMITNNADRDIDDIMMGVFLLDKDGNVLFSTGHTDMVTGSVWLAAGESMEISLFITEAALDRNPAGKKRLIDQPDKVGVSFEIHTVTYME